MQRLARRWLKSKTHTKAVQKLVLILGIASRKTLADRLDMASQMKIQRYVIATILNLTLCLSVANAARMRVETDATPYFPDTICEATIKFRGSIKATDLDVIKRIVPLCQTTCRVVVL